MIEPGYDHGCVSWLAMEGMRLINKLLYVHSKDFASLHSAMSTGHV